MGDPYRDLPEHALVPVRARRPRQIHWAAIIVAAGGGAGLIAGLPAGVVAGVALTFGALSYAGVALLRGRQARRVLSTLPFPVALGDDVGADVARPIREVEIELAGPLAGLAGDELAAQWIAHGLGTRVAGSSLVLTGWQWGAGDLAMLAELLDRTGRALHARQPIAHVTVHWAAAPTASI